MGQRHVLVTGSARGIGRVTAVRLAREGWRVHAGVRKEADGEALAAEHAGIVPVLLDITDPDHVAALGTALPRLDAVVNNAGVVVSGPVEGLPLDRFREQMEVNLFGQVAVTQQVLPLLRASRGRIVFVSSVSGRIATPMTGAYNASKFALEGMADALRMELRPWGMRVSLVEPAQTDTDMWQHAHEQLDADLAHLSDEHRRLYAGHIEGGRAMVDLSQRLATSPDGVAAAIVRALDAKRPRARYVVGLAPKVQAVSTSFVPRGVLDAVLRKVSGVPASR
jgi:NAD(P)-dependent dehydrogenase (short-subunit alcohol dehydrogenase family)